MTLQNNGHPGTLNFHCVHDDEVLYYYKGQCSILPENASCVSITSTEQKEMLPVNNKPLKISKIDINKAHNKYWHVGEKALCATLKILGIKHTVKVAC
jgi:hypothetical protein